MKNLQFIKFLFEVVEEVRTFNKEWISLHSTNLIFFEKENSFKYLYLP